MALRGGPVATGPGGGAASPWPEGNGTGSNLRVLHRRRPALNGRALTGGLLVAVAAVGLFAAYTRAGDVPQVAYVVAAHDLQPGQRVGPGDLTTARMLLPPSLADNDAYRDPTRLDGAVMVAPLRAGELVQASDVVAAADAPAEQEVSFSIDPARAVGGSLQPGETVSVVATYGSGAQAVTEVVVPLARVVTVGQSAGALGSDSSQSITLALDSTADVLAVTNAADAGQVELVRTEAADTGTLPYHPAAAVAP